MAKNYYDITLALAGISQSARLVEQLAHQGTVEQRYFHTTINSLLQMDPPSTLAVFGDQEINLKMGLEMLCSMLNADAKAVAADLMRYTINLMVLERKLKANKTALHTLSERLMQLERQLLHFELTSDTIISALADIYVDIISPLGPRIQITGSVNILQNPQVQAKIRAALLAGIRAAVLWQQVGGSRLQLIFSRQRLLKQAQDILSHG